MTKSVIVVGGSIAGLMHGLQHKRKGNDVTIIEQEPGQRASQDAGIGFGAEVNEFLKKYDLTGSQIAIRSHSQRVAYYKRPQVHTTQTSLKLTSWGLLYRLLRVNFDGLASAAFPVPPKEHESNGRATYLTGKKVVSLYYSSGVVTVRFIDVETGKEEQLSGDLLIGADGIHSTIRRLVGTPSVEQYVGYVSWRGTVEEALVSKETVRYFTDWLCMNITKNGYLVGYIVPTDDGNFTPGQRLINLVWYCNMRDRSPELDETFTDINEKKHQKTVPRGLVRAEVWDRARRRARGKVAEPFAEVLEKVQRPFVTRIHDAFSSASSFHDGHVVLVGDAFSSFRPHAATATEQAAFHSNTLEKVYTGEMTQEAWDREVLVYARRMILLNRLIGNFGRGALTPFLQAVFLYFIFVLQQKLRRA